MEYTVYLNQMLSASVTVEADDPDEAIDKAHESDLPRGICAQCSGWGQKSWSMDTSGDWEPDEVVDSQGKTVWGGVEEKWNE
jgi:hypothetical protein